MSRVLNFSAGPSALPEWVLKKAAEEMLDYNGSGQSVMEMSHRSPVYASIINDCEERLRRVLSIPENYDVLFLQGGASLQFCMVPMNLMNKSGKADYIITGQWANKAYKEGVRFGECKVLANSNDKTYSYIPKVDSKEFTPDADYLHICYNNTIYGTHYPYIPETGDVPLVADMSSCILSEKIDVSKFGLIYAGAQKNMGPAGLTVVIVRKDLVGNAKENTPTMLDYKTHADNGSMFNTPPTYAIYICGLVLRWIEEVVGGIDKMEEYNKKKAAVLYNYLDESKMFKATVEGEDRSLMNVPFVTGDEALDKKFIAEAKAAGLVNLAGHRSVGGMRASIYNAMTIEGVETLVEFMKKFEKDNAR
ncbi:MAG: 3-phosphoserine/phosphohydroxythreonine transaminase [Oscillospiraceae bacterium]|nr:3-phosphoserine/phosphohydroxythreonine transaminase [Oscillospiraceae bacterium]